MLVRQQYRLFIKLHQHNLVRTDDRSRSAMPCAACCTPSDAQALPLSLSPRCKTTPPGKSRSFPDCCGFVIDGTSGATLCADNQRRKKTDRIFDSSEITACSIYVYYEKNLICGCRTLAEGILTATHYIRNQLTISPGATSPTSSGEALLLFCKLFLFHFLFCFDFASYYSMYVHMYMPGLV